MKTIIAITPGHCVDPQIAIAATRAGEIGLLNLRAGNSARGAAAAIEKLRNSASSAGHWGVRWDALGAQIKDLNELPELVQGQIDILLLAGLGAGEAEKLIDPAKRFARRVFLEVFDLGAALTAQGAGFDGVVVKGHESGGRVGKSASFILLQEFHGKLEIPYWVQGGIGGRSAAAAKLAGARGVVLAEQLWLTEEGPYGSPNQKALWGQLDGSETVVVGQDAELVRLSSRHGRSKLSDLEIAVAKGGDWQELLRRSLESSDDPVIPLGQDIALAGALAQRHATVGGVITAIRGSIDSSLSQARAENPLSPDSPLAKLHGTRFPILQGPMTRVSDVAPFAAAVANGGGLPFLALAVMKGPQARELLIEVKGLMGEAPWGVGVLGFLPLKLRQAQMEAIGEVKPRFAIIAGGRPSQARELEALGISTYLHVPSPGLLEGFIKQGARKFIFEGSECGGHTGPRTSFILWESAVEILLNAKIDDVESVQVIFAGGVHDALSAAIVSVLAAPLSARGMKIGVLMGTAYLFTEEAVRSGAVVQEFQDQAISCRETALLQSGVGIYTRCAKTEFCNEFDGARRQLVVDAKSEKDILMSLELLNVGRLRIASKGVVRNEKATARDGSDRYLAVDDEAQRRDGLYMMGEAARLRSARTTIAELHNTVSAGAAAVLAKAEPTRERAAKSRSHEDIAVVGMACLMPGATDLRKYWQNILTKVDAIREVPEDRWRPADYFDPKRATPDKVYSKWGGFLEDIAFDPTRYGIPPASLPSIEPVQFLALHVASKALEDAGFDRRPFPRERTATIFAAGAMNELGTQYVFRTLLAQFMQKVEGISEDTRNRILASLYDNQGLPKWTADSFPGFISNVIPGRIANRLDLRGPNFAVDAACASSLAALDVGIRQLRDGNVDVALVGGVDAANGAVGFMAFAQTHALSPQGRCRPFDASADGIVLGEGVAAVVLKRLADAERDGDRIYAVIKGIGSSSDGHSRTMTAPDVKGQVLAIERAYADAGVDPTSVTLIEAHGTGTPVGDRSEIKALSAAFGAANAAPQSCAVGSVKSMIGHTKIAAGLAALIKASLALKHRVLPPTLGVERPLPRIDFTQTPFYINTQLRPWIAPAEDQPRRCGVSAFGFGGSNFHTVLEEYRGDYRATDVADLGPRPAEIFAFSRANSAEVEKAAKSLLESLADPEHLELAQLAYSTHLDEAKVRPKNGGQICQLAIVATSIADLKGKLETFLREFQSNASIKSPQGIYYQNQVHRQEAGAVCMLFPGQGSQQINMLRDLVLSRPSSYPLFERADALLKETLPKPLSHFVYPLPCFTKAEEERQQKELNDTRVAQPALGVVELAAFDILSEFGLKPNFVAGHSYGEYVALCVAGVISRDDLIRLSDVRGRIAAQASGDRPTTMAAVNASEQRVAEAIGRLGLDVSIANLNAPSQTIIAGAVEAIEAAVKSLSREAMQAKALPVTAAFHCSAMAGAQDFLAAELSRIEIRRPQAAVFSNTTAVPYPEEPNEIRALLARHIAEPLRFVDEIQNLYNAGARVFIETGPGLVLSGLVDRILNGRPHLTLGLGAAGRPGWLQLGHLLAQAFTVGLPIDLEPWFRQRGLQAISLAQTADQAKAKANPSATTWRVNGGRATPWHAPASLPKPKPETAAQAGAETQATPRAVINHVVAEAKSIRIPVTPGPNAFVEYGRRTAVGNHESFPTPAGTFSAPPDPLGSSLSQLIELQREQQKVLLRFIELQERGLPIYHQEALIAPKSELPAAAPQPVITATVRPAPAVIPPAPVLPKFAVAPSVNGSKPAQPAPAPSTPTAPVSLAQKEKQPATALGIERASDASKALPPTQQFKADLVRTVVERTGYAEEMLDLDAHMEADLGIDSIKRIEILSNLKDRYPFMEGQDEEAVFEELANLKTLNAIVAWYDGLHKSKAERGGSDQTKKALTPLSLSLPETVESNIAEANPAEVQRYTMTPVAAPRGAVTELKNFPANDLILLVGEVPVLSDAFRDALTARRYRVLRLLPGAETRALDDEHVEVDFSSLSAAGKFRSLLAGAGQKVGAILNLTGLRDADEEQHLDDARQLFLLLKVLEKDLKESAKSGGGWLVNLTAFDGQFGLRGTRGFAAAAAGTLGVAKSVALEWRGVHVKCMDVGDQIDPERLIVEVLREIGGDDPTVEVGLTEDGRWVLDLKKDSLKKVDLSSLELDPSAVLLLTGGAYGITADVAKAFAEKFRPRLVLVARSPMPEEETEAIRALTDPFQLKQHLTRELRALNAKTTPAEIERALKQTLKDRQIRANIAAMRASGAQVEYHALDLRDSEAFGRLIDDVYARFGRIDGVIHGAGMIDDKLIKDKSAESFDAVFKTKVAPASVLAKKLQPETLKFLVFFSSIAGRFGNAGQCDYSAANEVLNKLASRLRRDWPRVHTVSINWGPWDGGMVNDGLRQLFISKNIYPIPIERGKQCCLEELARGATGAPEIVVTASLHQITAENRARRESDPARRESPRIERIEEAFPCPVF